MVYHPEESFFKTITRQFGHDKTILLKSWINAKTKISTLSQQLVYLLRCRRCDILPPHIYNQRLNITFRSNFVNHKLRVFKKRYQRTMLNFEISDINYNLNFLRTKIKEFERQLFLYLPDDLVNNFFIYNSEKIFKHNNETKSKLMDKFNRSLTKQNLYYNSFLNTDRSKWIINISNKQIPDRITNFLSLGDRFGLPFNNKNKNDRLVSTLEVIKNFECYSQKIPQDIMDESRGRIADALKRFLVKKPHVNYMDRLISDDFVYCKKFLRDNEDIFVTKADKGQVTVVMDKNAYVSQMTTSLDDQTTYRKVNKDPIRLITTRFNELVKSWFDNDIIDLQSYRRMHCTNGNLPRCYGLPKIHKSGFPLRIIVSALGSPIYNVAKFLHDILVESVPKPKSYIKDSWSFVTEIRDQTVQPDDLLVSFDVKSLFTNIPKELVMNAIERRWSNISEITSLSLPQFLHAIDLILSSTYFSFNGQVYDQIFGSPMGSPLSPILANMVMDDLESRCLEALDFEIPVFYRYVDDIFAIVPKTKLGIILKVFNDYHPRLQFTYETESNNSLNFLDVTVIRNGNKLLTNWYRKPTFSGRYINFFSSHPFKYKVSVVTSLVDRAILLSNSLFHNSNIEIVKQILSNNCFPSHVVDKHVNDRIKQLRYRNNDTNVSNANNRDIIDAHDGKKFISVPYIKGLSSNLSRILSDCGFDILHTVPKKLDCIIKRGKDYLNNLRQTQLVYKINCSNCDATYIGQTKRHLLTRIKEHQSDIKKHDSNHSVISKHRLSHQHEFNWLKPEILHRENHLKKREIAEMFFIKKYDRTINLQRDTDGLTAVYDSIIKNT